MKDKKLDIQKGMVMMACHQSAMQATAVLGASVGELYKQGVIADREEAEDLCERIFAVNEQLSRAMYDEVCDDPEEAKKNEKSFPERQEGFVKDCLACQCGPKVGVGKFGGGK